jgi:hypothetical protein
MRNKALLATSFVVLTGLIWLVSAGDPEPPGPPAPTMVTLQELYDAVEPAPPDTCFDNVGRFVDCGDGTVKDNNTGLFWLKDADCLVMQFWAEANIAAAQLADGQCGLTDGSKPGDWRLPTLECPGASSCNVSEASGELGSLFAPSCPAPFIPDTVGTGCWSEGDPFSGVRDTYWSSSTYTEYGYNAWFVWLSDGYVAAIGKRSSCYAWPVRGGQ